MNFWQKLKKPFSVLAPMEEVTDAVFRQIVLKCGRPDVFFTEFVSTDGLMSVGREAVIHRLAHGKGEKPIVAQIWGTDPNKFFESAKLISEMGFDGIDINMGCPQRKIIKNGSCAALIQTPTLAKEIILATKEGAGEIPVSVKTRIGFKKVQTEEWIGFLLEQNLAALTIHARTQKEMTKVPANWDEIGKCVKLRDEMQENPSSSSPFQKGGLGRSKTVIIGNGDMKSLVEIQERHEKYGVDGVMVGRGIFQNPWLFNPNVKKEEVTIQQKINILMDHIQLFLKTWEGKKNFSIMRKFFKIYISGFDGASDFRNELVLIKSPDEVLEKLKNYPSHAVE